MKKETQKTVKMLATGFVVMATLSLSYRAWLYFHPQPAEPRQTLSELIAKTAEERAMRLLQTPLEKWTEHDKRSEPRIHAWLEMHAKTILPWEWTEEARKKDPAGYRELWLSLLDEQKEALRQLVKADQAKLKSVDRDIRIAKTIHAHRTNQIEIIKAYASSNSFPMTVEVERLSKGRLWGWNRRMEKVQFERKENFECERTGWLSAERKAAGDELSSISEGLASRKTLEDRIAANRELLSRAVKLDGRATPTDDVFLREMFRFLTAKEAPSEDDGKDRD